MLVPRNSVMSGMLRDMADTDWPASFPPAYWRSVMERCGWAWSQQGWMQCWHAAASARALVHLGDGLFRMDRDAAASASALLRLLGDPTPWRIEETTVIDGVEESRLVGRYPTEHEARRACGAVESRGGRATVLYGAPVEPFRFGVPPEREDALNPNHGPNSMSEQAMRRGEEEAECWPRTSEY